jgi:hypothetical protein
MWENSGESKNTHTPIGHYMRRHENFPKCKNYFLSSAIPFFGYLRRQCEKIEKTPFEIFPSQVYYTRDHTVAGIGQSIRPLNWIQVPPTRSWKKKNRSNCLAGTQDVVEKKLNRCHLYSSTGSECAGRELTISRCLFPIDYVKNWSGWWWGDYYEVRHYFCTRQKHQGKHYLAKTVKDDTRVGSSPLRYRLTP